MRAARPTSFEGIADPVFTIEPHPSRGMWVIYGEQCGDSRRIAVRIGRKRAERLARKLLRDYLKWKNRVLTETVQIDGPGSPQWEAECDEFGCHDGADTLSQDADTVWVHAGRWFDSHLPQPDLERQYVQRGTGLTEAPCRTCGEVVVQRLIDGRITERTDG